MANKNRTNHINIFHWKIIYNTLQFCTDNSERQWFRFSSLSNWDTEVSNLYKLDTLNNCIAIGCFTASQYKYLKTRLNLNCPNSKSKYISITLEACSVKQVNIDLILATSAELLPSLSTCLIEWPWPVLKREPWVFLQEVLKLAVLILTFDTFGWNTTIWQSHRKSRGCILHRRGGTPLAFQTFITFQCWNPYSPVPDGLNTRNKSIMGFVSHVFLSYFILQNMHPCLIFDCKYLG